jgi:hypothetical protein
MRRMVMLLTGALVMAAMMLVMAMPAFAFHTEGHTGGIGANCDPVTGSCNGGGGGIWPYACDTVTGECSDYPAGGGGHNTYDEATGVGVASGGGGGQAAQNPGDDQESGGGGGGGFQCWGNSTTGESGCVGGSGGERPGEIPG